MSRSKMAEEEECADVGEEGMDEGEREPTLAEPVWRCWDVWLESLCSL